MFKYKFSSREKILLGGLVIVVLVLLWYMFVFQRTTSDVTRINGEIATAEQENITNQQLLANMKDMEKVIAEHKAAGDSTVSIPTYDNVKPLMAELNGILGAASTYQLNFEDIDIDSSEYVLRPVQITFGCDSYATVENIANALANGTYPCVVSEIAFTDNTNNGGSGTYYRGSTANQSNYSATLTAVFFENFNDELTAAKKAKAEAEAAENQAASA